MPSAPAPVQVRHLGQADYDTVFAAMRAFTDARTPDTADELWIVEHPPVFTLGLGADRGHARAPGPPPPRPGRGGVGRRPPAGLHAGPGRRPRPCAGGQRYPRGADRPWRRSDLPRLRPGRHLPADGPAAPETGREVVR